MKKLILLILIIPTLSFSQEDDSLTIVAVGEAEKQVEKMFIPEPTYKPGMTPKDVKKAKEISDVVRSDFSFYIQLFEVEGEKSAFLGFDGLKKKGYSYAISQEFSKSGSSLKLSIEAKKLVDNSSVYSRTLEVDLSKPRSFAHSVSNEIYKALTETKSIFQSKILFVSDIPSKGDNIIKELYLMDFDGERIQRLTYKNGFILSPAFSPDNSKIMYTIIEKRWEKIGGRMQRVKNPNLYLMDTVTKKHKLISSENGINSGAIFDKNGDNIFLTLSYRKNADIYRMDTKTFKKSRVTNHWQNDVDPHINGEGNLLTFLSGRAGRAMIYTMDPSGVEKKVKRISYVGKFNAAPKFSPDGKYIAFSSWVDNRFDIYRIDSTGKNLVRLTKNFGSNEEPYFSPDGQFIVFTSQRVISSKKATQDIYIMTRDGKVVKRITRNFGKCFSPRWSNFL
jgi:TolB protein